MDGAGELNTGVRLLRVALVVVLVLGIGACIGKGADRPADPELGLVCSPEGAAVVGEDVADVETVPGDLTEVFGTVRATIRTGNGDAVELCLLHASTAEQRSRGLMEVTDLGGFDGMLFSYEEDSTNQFYMLNTPMPLSITWWRADGGYVSGTKMSPCLSTPSEQCERYPPAGPYRYALEVPQGRFAGAGVDASATLEVQSPQRAQ